MTRRAKSVMENWLVGDLKPLKNIEVYHHVMQGCVLT